MPKSIIRKKASRSAVTPNLVDYESVRSSFSWKRASRMLAGLPANSGLNIAYEAVDRHTLGSGADQVALRFLRKSGQIQEYTYTRLQELTNRFANLLKGLGVGKGDRVFTLAGRMPELYITALGTLKNLGVYCPLFSAFGPEPIRVRLSIGEARVLVTTKALYLRKVAQLRSSLPKLEHVLIVDEAGRSEIPDTLNFHDLLSKAPGRFAIPPTDPEDWALLHFTSGTTGQPKAAVHVHAAVLAHQVTGKYALDLYPEDIFWCTADPGWVTGTSYGIISPLTLGLTLIVDEEAFDATRWYRIIQDQRVSVWYTAPTAVRMMMKMGSEAVKTFDTGSLRFMASVGEPLNPEAVLWGKEAFGLPFHDNWWQTETGGIMIANYAAMDIKPGSMGRPLPGIEAAIVKRKKPGIELVDNPDITGELALKAGWPSMFRGYLGEDERYRACFQDGWYLTGDLARQDSDGYFWFVGRVDDMIKSAGHLIGPFEVESALMEHPAVAEVGVIGKPDPIAKELVKAFIVLKPGNRPDNALQRDLLGFGRKRLGAAIAPKELEFRRSLPKTRSGKIMRRLLKAQELALPEGDTSTLEETP
ncbi:MAG: acetate--CoA ligase [Gammaproteobacteria bacterium]|nr:acetate--CoA ligase [Gammaproteobacteria bacterium]